MARGSALALLCAAEILVALDGVLVSVALPSIQRDLGFSAPALQWVITAYTLTLGGFLLLGGRVADRFGRRRTLLAGLGLFTVASLAAGLARDQAPLLAARAAAGFGAALAIPAALALITSMFAEGRERNRALGVMSAALDVGMVTGAVLGGVVTAAFGWPWIFLAIVPVGAAAIAAIPRAIAADSPPAARRRDIDETTRGRGDGPSRRAIGATRERLDGLDVTGALLAAAGLALVVAGLTRAEVAGPAAPSTLGAFGLAAALLAAFVVRERRAANPLLPGRLVWRRRALAANLAIVANAGAFGGVLVLSTLYMQRVLGFSALEAGLGFVPLAVSAGVGGPAAGRLASRFGARAVVPASLLATAGCLLALSRTPADGSYVTALLPAFLVSGFTFATAAVPLTAEAVADAPPAEKGVAAALFQTCTHIGGAIVLAALVIAAAARSAATGGGGVEALVAGYRLAFALATGLLLAGAAAAVTLPSAPAGTARRSGAGPWPPQTAPSSSGASAGCSAPPDRPARK